MAAFRGIGFGRYLFQKLGALAPLVLLRQTMQAQSAFDKGRSRTV
jgi:hypothetical protein